MDVVIDASGEEAAREGRQVSERGRRLEGSLQTVARRTQLVQRQVRRRYDRGLSANTGFRAPAARLLQEDALRSP